MLIIKKLFIAIVGGLVAASAFYWYLDKENPLLQMAEHYQQSGVKPVQLPDLDFDNWKEADFLNDLSGSMASEEGPHAGADRLMEHWMGGLVTQTAKDAGKPPLAESTKNELVTVLMMMRHSAQQYAISSREGDSLDNATKLKIAAIMAKGEMLFSQHLGIPLSEFMATLTKKDLQTLLDPAPSA